MLRSDSRKINEGDAFIALKCVDNDGHKYVEKAISNGATKVIVEQGDYSVETLVVPDTREYAIKYLKDTYKNELSKIKIIGITGTNGKTTSAFMLHQALNMSGYKAAYIGTIGFYMGKKICNLPNTTVDICDLYELLLQCVDEACKYVVMEVSSEGLYRRRVEGIEFDYVAFTNLTQDHLNVHGTMENYLSAKKALFNSLKRGGKAFINIDDAHCDSFILSCNNNVTYGFNKCDYQILDYKMGHMGSVFKYVHDDIVCDIKTKLIGKYNLYNLLLVISILSELDVEVDVSRIALSISTPSGRLESIEFNNNTIVIDYAHTPDALSNIINTMKEIGFKNLYVVFGCTGDRDITKRPIMFDIASSLSDYVIITNDDPHNEDPNKIVCDILEGAKRNNYDVCLDRKRAIEKGIDLLKKDDILLILGKGHEEFMIIGTEKIPFSDRKVVDNYLMDLCCKKS